MAAGKVLRAPPKTALQEPAKGTDPLAVQYALGSLQRLALRAPANRGQLLPAAERRSGSEGRLRGAPADQPRAEHGWEPFGERSSRDRGARKVRRGAACDARGGEAGGGALEADARRQH